MKQGIIKKENEIKIEEKNYKLLEITKRKEINKYENINKTFDIYLNENDIQKTIENIQKNINNLSFQLRNKKDEKTNLLNSKELCNITDINNKKLYQQNYKEIKIKSDCYILIQNAFMNMDFDPIKDYDKKPESKGFNKSLIYYENENINIIFNQLKNDLNVKISYNSIKRIIINPVMKKIIH